MTELWCYVGKKQRRVRAADDPSQVGDFWTFIALDGETKLVPSFRVGKRDDATTRAFVQDLSSRLSGRVQLSSDMMKFYAEAIEESFGGNVDYGQIVKHYEAEPIGPGRYSPPDVVRTERRHISGRQKHICTSHVERVNLSVRMQMRRFTRLTNAFSKRADSLRAAVALNFGYYNLARIHSSLRTTPAQAAGIESKAWSVADLVALAN
jgi:IS1 family transposase